MRRLATALLVALTATPALAQATKEPVALRDFGSFHLGGRLIEVAGQPVREVVFTPGGVPAKIDPNGKYQVEQMYVQYFLPQNRRGKLPLLLWHGGGLSGVTYETKPDGGSGWMHYFIRHGWDTYVSDAVERGRSGWTSTFRGNRFFCRWAMRGNASASARSARGMTMRRNARVIRARNSRRRSTGNS